MNSTFWLDTATREAALGVPQNSPPASLEVHPLTPDRWGDLVTLFNGRGGSQVRGCWSMFYRQSGRADIPSGMRTAEYNKRALKAVVDRGTVPGLLGYRDGGPVAWVSLGPREDYAKLAKSNQHAAVVEISPPECRISARPPFPAAPPFS